MFEKRCMDQCCKIEVNFWLDHWLWSEFKPRHMRVQYSALADWHFAPRKTYRIAINLVL